MMDTETVKYLSQAIELEKEYKQLDDVLIKLGQHVIPDVSVDEDHEKLQSDLKDMGDRIVITRKKLMVSIDSLHDHDASEVLYLRYIRGYEFDRIADMMDHTIKWVYHKHQVAVGMVGDTLTKYKPRQSRVIRLISLISGDEVMRGSDREVAEYLNISRGLISTYVSQGSKIRYFVLVDVKESDEKVRELIYNKRIG